MDWQVRRRGHVDRAACRLRVIHADEAFACGVGEQRHRAGRLVADHAEVPALGIDGPRLDPREAVGAHHLCGIDQLRVVPHLHRGVAPPVVAMPHVARVRQLDVLLEHRPPRRQAQLHPPLPAVHLIGVPHPNRAAAVGVLLGRKVHGRHRHPVVRDRKVELHSEGRPRAAIANQRFLDRWIRVEHLPRGALVQTAVDTAAQIGQYRQPQVLVLQVQTPPDDVDSPVRQSVADGVRVVESTPREQVEGRIGIGRPLFVRGNRDGAAPHTHSGVARRGNQRHRPRQQRR